MKITFNPPPAPSAPPVTFPALFSASKTGFPTPEDKVIVVYRDATSSDILIGFPVAHSAAKNAIPFSCEDSLRNFGWHPVAPGHKVTLES